VRALLVVAFAAACAPQDPAAWRVAVRVDADVDLRPRGHEAAIGWSTSVEGIVSATTFVSQRVRMVGQDPLSTGIVITTDDGATVSFGAEASGPRGVFSSPPAIALGQRISLSFGLIDGLASAVLLDDQGLVFAASAGDHFVSLPLQDYARIGPGEREFGGFDHPCGRARWYDLTVRADTSAVARLGEREPVVVGGLDAWVVNGGTWRVEDWRGDCQIPRDAAAFVMGRER
jgi:hypothetical protein